MRYRGSCTIALIVSILVLGFVPTAWAALSAPTSLTATAVSSSQINLAWSDSNTSETGFAIERAATSSGPFSQIGTTGKNVTSYANTGLAALTPYYYRVRATGRKSTFSAYSNVAGATTSAPPVSDATPPSVSITTPPNGSTYTTAQTVSVNASASDNMGVTKVEFYENGALRGTDTTSPYSHAWSFTGANNGSHAWTSKAYDAANNVTTSSAVGTTVNIPTADTTPPTVSITSPASGTTYTTAQTVTVTATAADNVGVTQVQFFRDGTIVSTDTTAPHTAAWSVNSAENGAHTWAATAWDAAGNSRDAAAITLNVNIPVADTTAPSIPTGLSATAASCSQVDLSWNVSSDTGGSGLKGYNLYRNGVYQKQVLAPATSTSDTGLSASSTYSYSVSAVDNAGNASAQSVAAGVTTPGCTAAGGEHLWSRDFGGPNAFAAARPAAVVADSAGNVVAAGLFEISVDFGGGFLTSAGGQDIFVAKFSPTGAHLWSKRIGNTGQDAAYGVAVDGSGNVLVAGYFAGAVDFGGGALTSAGGQDIFLAKYSSAGAHMWSKRLGNVGFDSAYGVDVDTAGNVAIGGYFTGAIDLGGGALLASGGSDTFVAKYGPTGTHVWSRRMGGTGYEEVHGIAVDANGDVLVAGNYAGAGDFGGGPVSSVGSSNDIFVAKFLGSSGAPVWARVPGSTGDDRAYSLAVDSSGSVFLTGYFNGAVDFGGGPLAHTGGGADIFLAKYLANGSHAWSKGFGSSSPDSDVGKAVAVDPSGNVFLTGSAINAVNFGGSTMFGIGGQDVYLAKFSGTGTHLWSKRFAATYTNEGSALASDGSGNGLMAGFFAYAIDFGGGSLSSSGGDDGFLAKFGP